MKISKEQCKQFLNDSTINPLTGRKIEKGKVTYKQLTKACQDVANSRTLPKDYKVPPMGPLIHFYYEADSVEKHDDKRKNIIKMMNYFHNRIRELQNQDKVSKMELTDIKENLKHFKQWLENEVQIKNKQKLTNGADMEYIKTKELESKYVYDDTPVNEIFVDKEIKTSRYFNRIQVLNCYNSFVHYEHLLKSCLTSKTITYSISTGEINDLLKDKLYLDHLIKRKIFLHDDIYVKTFPGENCYDELKKTYEEYKKLYKKLKNKSP